MNLVTAEEMRLLDRLTIERHGTPGHVLMERAGRGAADVLADELPQAVRPGAHVTICAGTGNNGGDGFVVARVLRERGVGSEVFLIGSCDQVRGDARGNLDAWRQMQGPLREVNRAEDLQDLRDSLARADAVVDALFGTGLSRNIEGLHEDVIAAINAAGRPVLAIDIASGLCSDTGHPLGTAVRATVTATFAFAKVGQVVWPGVGYTGTLRVVDIGIAPEAVAEHPPRTHLLEDGEVAPLVPRRPPDAHKGRAGHVLVLAGSLGKTGAARLSVQGAARAGAGLVTLAAVESLYPVFAVNVLEAMTETVPDETGRIRYDPRRLEELVESRNVVVAGPGLGTHEDAERTIRWLVRRGRRPLVLDADGLTCLARDLSVLRQASAPVVLTPHPGEMARLCGRDTAAVQRDRVGCARDFAARHGVILVLKGARTVVADPSGEAWINPTGNPGMASGGMGDVLAGVIGGLLAQGLGAAEAARLGVWAHGEAADHIAARRGQLGMLAGEVADELPAVWHRLAAGAEGSPP